MKKVDSAKLKDIINELESVYNFSVPKSMTESMLIAKLKEFRERAKLEDGGINNLEINADKVEHSHHFYPSDDSQMHQDTNDQHKSDLQQEKEVLKIQRNQHSRNSALLPNLLVSAEAKKRRAQRFGVAKKSTSASLDAINDDSYDSDNDDVDDDDDLKVQKMTRAHRFGIVTPGTGASLDQQKKIARLHRFKHVPDPGTSKEIKENLLEARRLRFGTLEEQIKSDKNLEKYKSQRNTHHAMNNNNSKGYKRRRSIDHNSEFERLKKGKFQRMGLPIKD